MKVLVVPIFGIERIIIILQSVEVFVVRTVQAVVY